MRKIVFVLLSVAFFYFFYGLVISRFSFRVISDDLVPQNPESFYDYGGVINVHTNQSSGSGNFEAIIQAAQKTNVDYIIFTDLNSFDEQKNLEGYYEQTLVFIGGEYSYLDSRLLNFNATSTEHLKSQGRSQVFFADILSREEQNEGYGQFVLAHPLKPGYQWTGEYPVGLKSIEVFNLKTIWQWAWNNDRWAFAGNVLLYPFNPKLAFMRIFSGSSRAEISLWDKLNLSRKTVGFAGSAAESRVFIFGKVFELPSYQTLFSIIRNHVLLTSELTGNAEQDRKKIADALRIGQFYMGLDLLANPKGFNTYLQNVKKQIFPLGSEVPLQSGLEMVVQLPQTIVPFEVQIFKNGDRIMTSTSARTSFAIHGPGSYRVVVRLRVYMPFPAGRAWVPWVFTNPIVVK